MSVLKWRYEVMDAKSANPKECSTRRVNPSNLRVSRASTVSFSNGAEKGLSQVDGSEGTGGSPGDGGKEAMPMAGRGG